MNVKAPRGQVHGTEGIRPGGIVMAFCGNVGNTLFEQRIRPWDPSSKWKATNETITCKNCVRVIETEAKASVTK